MEQIILSSSLTVSVTAASAICTSGEARSALTPTQALSSQIASAITLTSPIDLEDLP